MADNQNKANQYNGGARPGVTGAIYDAIESVARAIGPKSITQIKARHDKAEQEAMGDPSEPRNKIARMLAE